MGTRLTRAIPMDELLQQLVETLRPTLHLTRAEVYAGIDGQYQLVASVPHRTAEPLVIEATAQQVATSAGVSSGAWIDVWLPQLVEPGVSTHAVPIAHRGTLLGVMVLRPGPETPAFDEQIATTLTDIARQVGLALHNLHLDGALRRSLSELETTNRELQDSRLRIVGAADDARRRLERDLHDGAQQRLVAMAVKLQIAADVAAGDPDAVGEIVEELRADAVEAIAELRVLAHGIFPPLLMSGGLAAALPAAATRAPLPTRLSADGVGRYSPEVEATVYFCCIEALQNAGKHAGESATANVTVAERDGVLRFEVSDDGAGFAHGDALPSSGHGFVNMGDRLGAVGGRLSVTAAPGRGTVVRGEIPLRTPPAGCGPARCCGERGWRPSSSGCSPALPPQRR